MDAIRERHAVEKSSGRRLQVTHGRQCVGILLFTTVLLMTGGCGASVSARAQETTPAQETASVQETFHVAGGKYAMMREVKIPAARVGGGINTVVVEFHHSGLLRSDGGNLFVCAKKGKSPTPAQLLQYGPGDFCRVAFRFVPDAPEYEIYYGGSGAEREGNDAVMDGALPDWAVTSALLCEVRKYVQCNADSADSVRSAFDRAEPIGAIFTPDVFVSGCPIRSHNGPCLIRYTGTLYAPKDIDVRFFTASQDASFVYIDGKPVTDAPGVHGAWRTAQAKNGGRLLLTAGEHRLEYYHVATSAEMQASLLWETPPVGEGEAKVDVTRVPSDLFRSARLLFAEVSPAFVAPSRQIYDFNLRVDHSAPCTEAGDRLILVTLGSSGGGADVRWDFGDGQAGRGGVVTHTYIGAGVRRIRMVVRGVETAYAMDVQPLVEFDVKETVPYSQLLPPILDYDTRSLPDVDLAIWVDTLLLAANQIGDTLEQERLAAREAAIEAQIAASADEFVTNERTGKTQIRRASSPARWRMLPTNVNPLANVQDPRVRILRVIYTKLADAGVLLFATVKPDSGTADTEKTGDTKTDAGKTLASGTDLRRRFEIARTLGPVIRDQVGDSPKAVAMWDAASAAVSDPTMQAEAHLRVVDLALHDRLDATMAAGHFASAQKIFGGNPTGTLGALYWRVCGDYETLRGKIDDARASYRNAGKCVTDGGMSGGAVQNTFVQIGSCERSTEAFLQEGRPDRAIAVLREWESAFPASKPDGAIGFFMAQYWMLRGEYRQAISEARCVAALSPDSPYADRALMLAADALVADGQNARALAAYQSLVKQYPGSSLAVDAREAIARLESTPTASPK